MVEFVELAVSVRIQTMRNKPEEEEGGEALVVAREARWLFGSKANFFSLSHLIRKKYFLISIRILNVSIRVSMIMTELDSNFAYTIICGLWGSCDVHVQTYDATCDIIVRFKNKMIREMNILLTRMRTKIIGHALAYCCEGFAKIKCP